MKIPHATLKQKQIEGTLSTFINEKGLHAGSVYRSLKNGTDLQVRDKTRFYCVWDYVDPEWLYRAVSVIVNRHSDMTGIEKEELRDFLLDFAYRLDLAKRQKPEGYLFAAMCRKVQDFKKSYKFSRKGIEDENNYIL
ncbi:MAG: hypothetical protein SVW57_10490 [Thermodesulfobacteriota bacterium]|nr:hypothetical protein [Thermodesulfobacteriota bacterium]